MNHRNIVTRYINAGKEDNPAGFWASFVANIVKAVKLPSKFTITDVSAKQFGRMVFTVEVKENAKWPHGKDGFIASVVLTLDAEKDAMRVYLNFGSGYKNTTLPMSSSAVDIGKVLSESIDRNTKSLQEM